VKPLGSYPFTPEFQRRVVALALADRSFYAKHSRAIAPEYFTAPGLGDLFREITAFYEGYRAVPSREMFVELVREGAARGKMKAAVAAELVAEAELVAAMPADDLGFVRDRVVDWMRNQVVAQTAMRLADLYERAQATGKPATEEMHAVMQEAMTACATSGADWLDYFEDLVPRVFSNQNALKIPTGYKTLDEKLEGGTDPGELFVFLGGPSMGKTSFLVGMARSLLMHRYKVAVVTNEVSPRRWAARVDRALIGKTRAEIAADPRAAVRAITRVRQVTGRMIVKGFPSGSATVEDVEAFLTELRDAEGFTPDILIDDYADEHKSSLGGDDFRLGVIDVYRRLRSLGQRWGIPVATASQAGKQAEGKAIVNMRDAAEAYAKNAVADIVVALCQTEEEAAEKPPVCRLYGAKNREGERRFNLPYAFDAARGVIVPTELEEKKPDETVVKYEDKR